MPGSTSEGSSSGGPVQPPQCEHDGDALPIVPCGEGYGIETPAGSGRHLSPPQTTIMVVDSLEASGPGTLRACAEASGPRTCVFAVSGVIDIESTIDIESSYLTIAGQTAPSPGISVHGAGIRVMADDILIQHLRVRVGDRFPGPPVHNRDALWISNPDDPPERIVIDHCSLSLSSDEMLSVWNDAGDITVVDSLLGWPLNDSIHIDEGASEPDEHGFGPLFGEWNARIYVARSGFVHQYARNPLSRTAELVFANNVVLNFGIGGTTLAGDNNATANTLLDNVYRSGADTPDGRLPIRVDTPTGSTVYIEGLVFDGELQDDPWSVVDLRTDAAVIGDAPQTALVPETLPAEGLEAAIAPGVGAWPQARDSIDVALVDDLLAGTGRIINCVEDDGSSRCSLNAGGWPELATQTHRLDVPADPMGDDDGDGYTNLEGWLHTQAQLVQAD